MISRFYPPKFKALAGLVLGVSSVAWSASPAATTPDPASNAPVATQKPVPPAPQIVDGSYLKLGFEHLGNYKIAAPAYDAAAKPGTPPPSIAHLIPDSVKTYDGKKAVITGFMLPVKIEGGFVTELLLMRDPMMCCYGVVPQINEWVTVKMAKGVRSLMDTPVSFYGVLHVKEMYENGYLTGIYLLDGEKMAEAK
jgi:hypothetical protein